VIIPCHELDCLGVLIDSIDLSLTEDKLKKSQQECASLLSVEAVSVRQLAALIGKLLAATVAISPAPLY
jgi:hypothetical protein